MFPFRQVRAAGVGGSVAGSGGQGERGVAYPGGARRGRALPRRRVAFTVPLTGETCPASFLGAGLVSPSTNPFFLLKMASGPCDLSLPFESASPESQPTTSLCYAGTVLLPRRHRLPRWKGMENKSASLLREKSLLKSEFLCLPGSPAISLSL